MRIDVLSTFPTMIDAVMGESIMKRAQLKGVLSFQAHDLRDWTHDRHRTTDDEPYGGGPGLLMKPEPIFEALDDLSADDTPFVVFMTPEGIPFKQEDAHELGAHEHLVFVCGHYEGMDERVYSRADACYSLGDYVLTGGELPALVMIDAVVRLLPGVLGDGLSAVSESFSDGLLEYPQYTRPESYRGLTVPPVLLSGDHGRIAAWRREQSLLRTVRLRPDLLRRADMNDEERMMIRRYLGATGEEQPF
jgi:tRNA (guanine37-N1)-methyltransferase